VYDVTLKTFVLLAAVAGAVAGTGVLAGTSSVVYDVTLKTFVLLLLLLQVLWLALVCLLAPAAWCMT
jgi:hypothetical protein